MGSLVMWAVYAEYIPQELSNIVILMVLLKAIVLRSVV